MKKTIAVIFLFTGLGVMLYAQDEITSLLSNTGFTVAQRESIEAFFIAAADENIPVQLLIPKLEEGIAKKIPAGLLLRALQKERDSLKTARTVLEKAWPAELLETHHAEWMRTAILITNGYHPSLIEKIAVASVSRPPDYRPATELYVVLVSWGLSETDTLDVVTAILASSIPGGQFGAIPAIFTRSRQFFLPSRVVVERIRSNAASVSTVEDLAKRTLY